MASPLHNPDEGLGAHAVDIGDGASGEGRVAEAENRADVSFAHVSDDTFLDATSRFESLNREQPRLQFFDVKRIGIELGRLQLGKPWP